jgi:hypothetical protein
MPLESAPYWFAKCDNCGDHADYDEYSAFQDPGHAGDAAIAIDWTSKGETWHCPQCPPLLDEDEEMTA